MAEAPRGPSGGRLGVVVVNYRSSGLIARNLGGIDWAAAPPATVVVVDNRSSAGERRAIGRLADERSWLLIGPGTNLGFGAAANRGAARALAAGCDALLLLNPDVTIDAAALGRLTRAGLEHPRTLVSPTLVRPDGRTWFAGAQVDLRTGLTRSSADDRRPGAGSFLTAACLLADRESWEMLGGFDERFFLYWEDVDLSRRFVALGGALRVLPDVVAVHRVGGTQRGGAGGRSARYGYFMCRNRLLFATGHLGAGSRARWLRHAPRYAARVVLRDGRRAALTHPSIVLAALAGTLAGAARLLSPLPATRRLSGRSSSGP